MSKLKDDLYQRFNGFKPVKNAKGEWYYIDPRYESNDPRSQIKVANENSPNPKIDEILEDDMNNNPEDYYIWHTQGDDKVRSSHAERDGEIFNYNVPPEGGNPGEDYNCRCWAESYKSQKSSQSDVAKVNLSGLPQYEGNEVRNIFTDATNDYAHRHVKFRSIEEEKLLKRIGKQIIGRENSLNYAYIDSSGYITTGNGALIDDWNDFKKVHWLYNGRPATETEMRAEFEMLQKIKANIIAEAKIQAIANNIPYSNPFQKITANYYKDKSILRITKDEADYLMYSHLQKDYDNLKRYLPEIDNAPQAAQDVAFDIQYNPGITSTTWTNFKNYFNNKNINELAKQVHRIGISENRNNEMRDKILSIKKW